MVDQQRYDHQARHFHYRNHKLRTFLHGISQSKWGIRGAVNVYNNAVNNEDISYDGLYAMARTMGIGLV